MLHYVGPVLIVGSVQLLMLTTALVTLQRPRGLKAMGSADSDTD
jgi:hypothetical protein